MLGRKVLEVGSEEASAARSWVDEGYAFCLFKSRLWAEFGRIILYYNVMACLLQSRSSLRSSWDVSIHMAYSHQRF